jgi:hypothetical protein
MEYINQNIYEYITNEDDIEDVVEQELDVQQEEGDEEQQIYPTTLPSSSEVYGEISTPAPITFEPTPSVTLPSSSILYDEISTPEPTPSVTLPSSSILYDDMSTAEPTPSVTLPSSSVIYGDMSTAPVIANLTQQPPILQQQKSKIITNPFISDNVKLAELNDLQDNANLIIQNEYDKSTGISSLSLFEIHKNITNSFIGFLNDLLNKKDDSPWIEYFFAILKKDQRYVYIGMLLIIIAFIILLVSSAD